MTSKKELRQEHIDTFGNRDMFEMAQVEKKLRKIKGIKTFKQFNDERKGKKKYKRILDEERLDIHHLKHRSENGANTFENTVLISKEAHQYMHSLPRKYEEVANSILREFKINYIAGKTHGTIEVDTDNLSDTELKLYDNTPEDEEYLQRYETKHDRRSREELKVDMEAQIRELELEEEEDELE